MNKANSQNRTASIYRTDRVHQSPFGLRDAAGNAAIAQTDRPVPLDVTEPELSNVTIEPAGR